MELNIKIGKIARKMAIWFLIVLLIETIFFNFPFWESLFFTKNVSGIVTELDSNNQSMSEGYTMITSIDGHVSNLYLDIFTPEAKQGDVITVAIGVSDESSKNAVWLGESDIVKGIDESSYIRLRTNGKTTGIYISVLHSDSGYVFRSDSVDMNKTRPFEMHLGRIFVVFIIGILAMLFMPESSLYKVNLDFKKKFQKDFVFFMVFVQIITFMEICLLNRKLDKSNLSLNETQYNLYGESLSEGVSNLYQINVPEAFTSIDNPYDKGLRDTYSLKGYEGLSYYNGKFYSSLGILPAMTLFAPYHAITGGDLDPAYAMILIVSLLTIAVFRFVYVMACKYASNISFGMYLLLSYVVLMSIGVLQWVKNPVATNIPVAMSTLMVITALTLWMTSYKDGYFSAVKLILGSLLMGMLVGTTPIMAISFLLVFPVFTMEMRDKKLFAKDTTFNSLCLVLPYILIGFIFLMYNYMRFGSFFEFGTSYVLTNVDMLHNSFKMSLFPLGIFEYLFQPLNITPSFPYINPINLNSVDLYSGLNVGTLIGGFFAINLIAISALMMFIPSIRKQMKGNNVFVFAFDAFFYGIVALLVVIQRGTMSLESMGQFGIFFVISMLFVIFTICSDSVKTDAKLIITAVILLSVLCIVMNYWIVLAMGSDSFVYYNFKFLSFALR